LKNFDAIVIGAGAMGSSTCYQLARKGLKILCLEKYALNHSYGSSHGRTRIIRTAYYEHPRYVPLIKRAFEIWRNLEKESGRKLLKMTGGLFIGPEQSSLFSGAVRSAREHKLDYKVLDAKQIEDRFPVFRMNGDEQGLFETQAGILFPENCIETFVELAKATGRAEFHFNEALTKWRKDKGRIHVSTSGGEEYSADKLVLAAGSWLTDLVPKLGLPLKGERQVLLWFEPKKNHDAFSAENLPITGWDYGNGIGMYTIPDVGHGVKAVQHHGGELTHPDRMRREVTPDDVLPVRNFLHQHIPLLESPPIESKTCIYTNTPDGHFLIDFHPTEEDAIIVSPCSGHGFKFASVVGEIVSELAVDGKTNHDISMFKIGRFGIRNI
jgi:sarcosine oxidase